MASDVLKEFLVAIGFKVDEASYKKQADAVDKVNRQLGKVDRDDKERITAEQRRHEVRKRNAEGLAVALGGVAAAAAAAATVVGAAMVKIAGGFDQFYFISQRTGASVNQIKGLSYAFSQVGSTAESAVQAIESFAKARRTNPGINGLLRSYGVDTRGDTAEVLTRSINAIQDRHPYYTGSQVAGLLGISEEQFQTFTKYREQIKSYREEYGRLQRTLNVNSDETARASASIQRSIGSLTATLGVLVEKLYTALAPVLERIVKGFQDWIASHPEQVDKIMQGVAHTIEAVGNSLIALGDWLGDEKNQKALADFWDKFASRVTEAAKSIKDLLETLFKVGQFFGLGGNQDTLGTLATRALGRQPQVAEGDNSAGTTYTPLLQRGWNAVKRAFGGGSAEASAGAGTQARAPGAAGKYRPVYSLSDADLDQRVINTIAGEVSTKNPEGVDAVINNMLNRVGSKGWGPSGNLLEVARAKGQYAGYRAAGAAESEFVRSRIKAIASGGVPDNTNGSNAYRAAWYSGPWGQKHAKTGTVIGGNRFDYEPQTKNGPYAPYAEPKADAPKPPPAPRFSTMPDTFKADDYLRSQPMGSTSNSNDNSRTVSQNNPVTVNVQGAGDPQATGSAVARAVGTANDMSLRNVQTAIR